MSSVGSKQGREATVFGGNGASPKPDPAMTSGKTIHLEGGGKVVVVAHS